MNVCIYMILLYVFELNLLKLYIYINLFLLLEVN